MASKKKFNKLKNGFLAAGVLKNKGKGMKGLSFYTPSDRQVNKRTWKRDNENI